MNASTYGGPLDDELEIISAFSATRMGIGRHCNKVFVVDFGLAKKYRYQLAMFSVDKLVSINIF